MNKTYTHWKYETDAEHILWLTLDRQDTKVNTLNEEVVYELNQILKEIENTPDFIGVVIVSGKKSGFIAGADIEQFEKIKTPEQGFDLIRKVQIIFDRLEALKIPTLALIQGFCLGGGLELALACRYRIVEEGPKTQLGAPEVKLGLHPGWGGTIRLPRLLGVFSAMEMNLAGKVVDAKTALRLGLVDLIVPEQQLRRAARAYILNPPPQHVPSVLNKLYDFKFIRTLIARFLYKNLSKKVIKQHYPAPYAIVNNWSEFGIKHEKAMDREAESISALMLGETSRNLVRVFSLQTRLKSLGKGTQFAPKHVHVIGAGVMGGDIAAWCALKGFTVTLQDRSPEFIAPAIKRAYILFQKKLNLLMARAAFDRLIPDVEGNGVVQADVVIEAVPENLQIKQAIYKQVEPLLKPDAVFATNTSSLMLNILSACLQNPARLLGIHFFNPVPQMQLVEVVQSELTDTDTLNRAIAFVRALDKLPLPVQSQPGFLVNRILMPYLMEAITLYAEGNSPEAIDEAALEFGMPMGPIELADTVGLDVCLAVGEILEQHKMCAVPDILKRKVLDKHLGRKSGEGFYNYAKGHAVKGKAKSNLSANILTDRLILPMLNESVACLRERIVADADLLDAGMIFGTGFAPFRGGPMQYAKSEGMPMILERLKTLENLHGERFKADEGWVALNIKG